MRMLKMVYRCSTVEISTKVLLPAYVLQNSGSGKLFWCNNWQKNLTNMLPTYVIRQAKKCKHSQEFSHIYSKTQQRILMIAYFMSQFGYCPLFWTLNNHMNGLHKTALSLLCNMEFSSSFLELLKKNKSVTLSLRHWNTELMFIGVSLTS